MNINVIPGTALLAVVGLIACLGITSSLGNSLSLIEDINLESAVLQGLRRNTDVDRQVDMLKNTTNVLVSKINNNQDINIDDAILTRYNLMKTLAINNPAIFLENSVGENIRSRVEEPMRKYIERKVSYTGLISPMNDYMAIIVTPEGVFNVVSPSSMYYDETVEKKINGVLIDNVLVAISIQ